jgi:hypothetical protein
VKKKSAKAYMPRFHKVSVEMQRWAAMLREELEQWPGVTTKPMFGFTSFYRGKTIFAAVPKTKALGSPHSLIFKLPEGSKWRVDTAKDIRIPSESMATHKWLQFEIGSESDLRDALVWLERAFESAKSPSK